MMLSAMGETVGKKIIRENVVIGPWLVYAMTSLFDVAVAVVMFFLGMGESGKSPISILAENPLIILSSLSTCIGTLLTFIALKYIGLSIESVISGVSAIFLFLGIFGINIFTGKLNSVKEILFPGRLIPIIVTIALIFLLSKTDEKNVNETPKNKIKTSVMLIGITFMLLACIFDASDSIIFAYFISEKAIGAVDYYMAASVPDIFVGIFSSVMVCVMSKKENCRYPINLKNIIMLLLIGVFSVGSLLTYVIGSEYDAVKFAMLYIAYPIVPLIGARIFLKEKYTLKQYLYIIGIAIASVVFCIMDYV